MVDLTVQYLGAASALFLSALIIIAIVRQKTSRKFQKNVLLLATLLMVSTIVMNVLISMYIKGPALQAAAVSGSQEGLKEATILMKRVQASLGFLFAITIGAFIVITTDPRITNRKEFWRYLKEEFPSSYLFYVFILCVGLVSIALTSAQVSFPNWRPGQPSTDPTVFEFPLWFQFVMVTGVATNILFAMYKLIGYMRKTRPAPSVVRDTYLILLGIIGFALSELVFEVVLPGPGLGIDLRALGFVIETALIGVIAFGIREKGFLHELLIPQAEADLTTAPAYPLDRGAGYVVVEAKPIHSFEIFRDLVTHGAQGLCITRTPPKTIVQQYKLEKTPILWLSRVANAKNCVRPSPPENVAMAVEHFISMSSDSVVLLDGLEYLIAHNDFASVLALLHDMNENVSLHDSVLLIPLDPRAVEEREFALIRRDLQSIYPEGSEEPTYAPPPIEVHERRRSGV